MLVATRNAITGKRYNARSRRTSAWYIGVQCEYVEAILIGSSDSICSLIARASYPIARASLSRIPSRTLPHPRTRSRDHVTGGTARAYRSILSRVISEKFDKPEQPGLMDFPPVHPGFGHIPEEIMRARVRARVKGSRMRLHERARERENNGLWGKDEEKTRKVGSSKTRGYTDPGRDRAVARTVGRLVGRDGYIYMRPDFMMFFDATARPGPAGALRGKRWSGNELESAASYALFRDLAGTYEEANAHLFRGTWRNPGRIRVPFS